MVKDFYVAATVINQRFTAMEHNNAKWRHWKAIATLLALLPLAEGAVFGSCDFEDCDRSCNYQQPTTSDNFNWSCVEDPVDSHYMRVDTSRYQPGSRAELITPEIKQQDTHCFTFRANVDASCHNGTAATDQVGQLNVYLDDHEKDASLQPVWQSDHLRRGAWETIQLALNPRAYQVIFEALALDTAPCLISIDDILVNSAACAAAPHFLRLGDKAVNRGQTQTFQCLLWGHSGPDTLVILQKSTGEKISATSQQEFEDHLSVSFSFDDVSLNDDGVYRCLSGNATQVGVSNYARLTVKVPPTPKLSPKVVQAGATSLLIELNADQFSGDGPIVRIILKYRPVDGSWSDVHHITSSNYTLWHLQPDTEYELAVTLARPNLGGAGSPGPKLITKTKCGYPKTSVQGLKFQPLGPDQPDAVRITWDAPDFSLTQCHNYAFVVKYRQFDGNEPTSSGTAYQTERVEKRNSVIIRGLQSFMTYRFKVELTNSAGSKETGEYTVLTSESVPGSVPPGSFVTTHVNDTAISLDWDEPLQPNGMLTGYEVTYKAEESFDPSFDTESDKRLYQIKANETSWVLQGLHPGTRYLIAVRARTDVGFGPGTEIIVTTDIAAPTIDEYPDPSDAGDAKVTPSSIEITIKPALSNGAPITNYYVIVEDVSPGVQQRSVVAPAKSKKASRGKGRKKNKRHRSRRSVMAQFIDWLSRSKRQAAAAEGSGQGMEACYRTPITYEAARRNNKTVYSPVRFDANEINEETKFVVGGGSESDGFSNPPLDPSRDYNIYIRVESSADGETKVNCVLVAKKSHIPFVSTPTTTTKSSTPGGVLVDTGFTNAPGQGESTPPYDPGHKDASETGHTILYAGIGGAIVGFLLIVIVIVFIVMRVRNKKGMGKDEVVNPFEVRMMMSDMNSPAHTLLPVEQSGNGTGDRQALMPDVVGYEHQDIVGIYFLDKTSESGGGYATTSNDERFAVRVDDFHVHVSQMKAKGGFGFSDEFSAFPDGPTAPWTVANNSLNRGKNRYGNIMAYDHSRVVLEPAPGHEEEFNSDYINASYINGYKKPGMFIATQAPTVETASDFWWMIWQEKSNLVVMVTNLVEMGKRKCHKYWPDDREAYGSVEVTLNTEERIADCIVRSFVLQQVDGYDVREVKQFHFTAWPDHGVPCRPTNLLSFIRRVKAYEPQGQGATVVHCSAGSGRTGCFIVIDMMLDMARDEEIVDIHNTVRDLRSRRVNMVQTEEQYVFIHETVLEALLCGETSVTARQLSQHYDDLITVDSQTHFAPIQEEFETLNVVTPKLSEDKCSVARLPRNRALNRFMDVLPADGHLAYLVTPDPSDKQSNYINAVYLDSYFLRNSFLVTQMPLPNTVTDIWRLINDHNCTSIVMMNDISEHDQTCSQYWPEGGTAIFGPFTVELLTKDDEVDVVTRLFKLQKPGEPYRLVQQFQLTNWPAIQPVPYSRNSVLRVIQLVMQWKAECASTSGNPGRTLVHCVAGAGRSGTFMACHNMCEQLRQEYAVDVFNIVQRLRNVRPQLVETLEQYRFCYEVGIEFAER